MAKPFGIDLRVRVIAAYDRGMKLPEVAETFQVSERWIHKLLKQRRESGSLDIRRGQRGPKPKLAAHTERLKELVCRQPDATLEELHEKLGVPVCLTTIWNALQDLGLSFKKSAVRRRATPA